MIRIRNLPPLGPLVKTVRVKPVPQLLAMMITGLICLFISSTAAGIGICLMTLSLFAMWLLPDHMLLQFTPQYLILYNDRERTDCALIYWEDVVQWQYEWHASADILSVKLVNGNCQMIEVYSKRSVAKYFNEFAPGKEVRNSRIKEDQA